MKVIDLIEQLRQLNPDSEVVFGCSIEIGRSLSICEDGCLGIVSEDSKVYLTITGEESDSQ